MNDISIEIQRIISQYLKIPLEKVLLTSTLDELKIDFFDLFELVNLIEKKFSIKFTLSDTNFDSPLDTFYDDINRVQDLVNLTIDQISRHNLIVYKANETLMYKYKEIEFSQRYVELFTAFTLLCDYYTKRKKVNLFDSQLDILHQLSLNSNSNDYSNQLKYLRYEIPMSRFVPDLEIIEFLALLKKTRDNY